MLDALVGNLARLSFLVDAPGEDAADDPPTSPVAGLPARLAPGQRFGAYILETPLGRGGMAEVWCVRHARLGSLHALKVPLTREPAALRRAVREARLQATLRHPNILAATDLVDVFGAPGLLLELVDGGETLEARLAAGRLQPDEITSIFEQILDAVEFAHSHGVVHRDLKPGNILLAHAGERIVAHVADFGLARSLDEERRLTRSGQVMGSPLYMAPEQARDAAAADIRADIFALGAILYEMATGDPAFDAPSIDAILGRAAQGRFAPPEHFGVPPAHARAVRAALAADPDRRPQDVSALRALFTGRPSVPSVRLGAARACPTRGVTGFVDDERPLPSDLPCPAAYRPPRGRPARLPWRAVAAGAAFVAAAGAALAYAAAQG